MYFIWQRYVYKPHMARYYNMRLGKFIYIYIYIYI
jgi:hypothetical protein